MKRFDPRLEITRLDQRAHLLTGLLDALSNLTATKLDDGEASILVQCQLHARNLARDIDEAGAPLNTWRAA